MKVYYPKFQKDLQLHKSIVCKLQSVPVVPQSRSGARWRELGGTGTSMNGLAACPAINKSIHFLVKFPLTIRVSPLSAQDLTCHLGILPTALTLSPMARILPGNDPQRLMRRGYRNWCLK